LEEEKEDGDGVMILCVNAETPLMERRAAETLNLMMIRVINIYTNRSIIDQ